MLQKNAFFLGLFTEKTYFCTIIEENYNKRCNDLLITTNLTPISYDRRCKYIDIR